MAQLVQNQNAFAMTPILGQASMIPNPDIISARLNPSSVAVVQAGSVVKLIAGTANEILVDASTGPTDGPVFGTVVYNPRKSLYAAGDIIEVMVGGYMLLKASAAITRGAVVAGTQATAGVDPTVATDVTSGHFGIGIAVDSAAAADALIRVKVSASKIP